jgi:hypothetical protein
LNFIFLTDEDRADGCWNHNDRSTSQQLVRLEALNFIFLTDEDQTDGCWNYNDQSASQQAVHEISQ